MRKPRRFASARRASSGHTLVELVVVTVLMALLTVLIAQAWRPIGQSTAALRAEAAGMTELRLALAFLRQDFGATEHASAVPGGGLELRRELAALERFGRGTLARDPGVLYRLEDDQLLRIDRLNNERFSVAREIRGLRVENMPGGGVRVQLQAGRDPEVREIEVVWTR